MACVGSGDASPGTEGVVDTWPPAPPLALGTHPGGLQGRAPPPVPKAQEPPAQFRRILNGGAQEHALVVQLRELLIRAQRRVVEVERHTMAEHRLEANRLAHRVRKLPLLDVAIEVKSFGHDGWHLDHLGALHSMQHYLPEVGIVPKCADQIGACRL